MLELVLIASLTGRQIPVQAWEVYNYKHCEGAICHDPSLDNREEWCYRDYKGKVICGNPKPWGALECKAPGGGLSTKCARRSEF